MAGPVRKQFERTPPFSFTWVSHLAALSTGPGVVLDCCEVGVNNRFVFSGVIGVVELAIVFLGGAARRSPSPGGEWRRRGRHGFLGGELGAYIGWYFCPLCRIETITHHMQRATATIAFLAVQRALIFLYTLAQRRVLLTNRQAVSTRVVRSNLSCSID